MIMSRRASTSLLATALAACSAMGDAPAPAVARPTNPPSLTVVVMPGPFVPTVAGSAPLTVLNAQFAIDPPDQCPLQATGPAPGDVAAAWSPLTPWPERGLQGRPGAMGLAPRSDDDGSLILGGLFRQLLPETVRVVDADAGTAFVVGQDYALNTEWAQVAAIGGRLGTAKIRVDAQAALQRLDLLQLAPDGSVSLKRGVSRLVCPQRPDPDPGRQAFATVYVAPWRRDGQWVVAVEDLLPIRSVAPVAPVRPEAVAKTLAKLRAGEPVRLAFMGDSITLGAEAGPWWSDDHLTWRGRVVRALRAQFPKSAITEVQAFKGGRGIDYGMEILETAVLPDGADLLFLALGINDAPGPIGGEPKTPPALFEQRFEALVRRAREAGIEVVVLTSMQPSPFHPNGAGARWPDYVEAQRRVAAAQGAGLADTYVEWMNLASRGIPPFSQLHNWINHPGAAGHALFADVVLRFFPTSTVGLTGGATP